MQMQSYLNVCLKYMIVENSQLVQMHLQQSKLVINVNKCKIMTFSRRICNEVHNYSVYGNLLQRCNQFANLGVVIDSTLPFSVNINHIITSSFKMTGIVIRSTRDFYNIECLKTLCKTLIRSKLQYGSVVWNPHYSKYMDQ